MATQKSLKAIIEEAAKKFAKDFQSKMPVRTGRLRKGIKYEVITENNVSSIGGAYKVLIISEDYLKWLKDRTKPLPTNILKWTGVIDQLPEMNKLGNVKPTELSNRAKSLIRGLNFEKYLDKDEISKYYEDEITRLIETELTF